MVENLPILFAESLSSDHDHISKMRKFYICIHKNSCE